MCNVQNIFIPLYKLSRVSERNDTGTAAILYMRKRYDIIPVNEVGKLILATGNNSNKLPR